MSIENKIEAVEFLLASFFGNPNEALREIFIIEKAVTNEHIKTYARFSEAELKEQLLGKSQNIECPALSKMDDTGNSWWHSCGRYFSFIIFKGWVKSNKEGSEDNMISETAFGILLNKSKEAGSEEGLALHTGCKNRINGVMKFKWNIESVIHGLKKLHLLEPSFKYYQQSLKTDADDVETDTD